MTKSGVITTEFVATKSGFVATEFVVNSVATKYMGFVASKD